MESVKILKKIALKPTASILIQTGRRNKYRVTGSSSNQLARDIDLPVELAEDIGIESDDLSPTDISESVSSGDVTKETTANSHENKELRAPLYNVEDYIIAIRKFAKMAAIRLYVETQQVGEKKAKKRNKLGRTDRNESAEMSMKQFGSVSELLKKLRLDLRLSFPSFVKEFVSDPYDGVTGLLDMLKNIQLSQTEFSASGNTTLQSREQHQLYRSALYDEHDCLLCLRHCLRCDVTVSRLVQHSHALYTVAVCTMSNNSRSRVLALELLTVASAAPSGGHQHVIEAISTLRLKFGEPVRFKFLVGMLNSLGTTSFQIACLRFINRLMETCSSRGERVHLQTELEEAGFTTAAIKQCRDTDNSEWELVGEELDRWQRGYLDVDQLCNTVQHSTQQTSRLNKQLASVKDDLQKGETLLQKSRSSEKQLRNRIGELHRQIEFYKNQLLLTRDECDSLGRQLIATSSECCHCSKLQLRSLGGSVSCSNSSFSDCSSEANHKEKKTEEKEKESASDEDHYRNRTDMDDFENNKICSEVIEVPNDMIALVPCKHSATQTFNSAFKSSSIGNINDVKQRSGKQPSIATSIASCQQAEIEEAIGQLTAVLHEAETTFTPESNQSNSHRTGGYIDSKTSSSPSGSSAAPSLRTSQNVSSSERSSSNRSSVRSSDSCSSKSNDRTRSNIRSSDSCSSKSNDRTRSNIRSSDSCSSNSNGRTRSNSRQTRSSDSAMSDNGKNRLKAVSSQSANSGNSTTSTLTRPSRRRRSSAGTGLPEIGRLNNGRGDGKQQNKEERRTADTSRFKFKEHEQRALTRYTDGDGFYGDTPAVPRTSSVQRSGSFCGVSTATPSSNSYKHQWTSGVPNSTLDQRRKRNLLAGNQTNFSRDPRGFISRGHSNAGRYSRADAQMNSRRVMRSTSRAVSSDRLAAAIPRPDYDDDRDEQANSYTKQKSLTDLSRGSIMDMTSALY